MVVTGYELREALRNWRTRREVCQAQFRESLFQFEDDKSDDFTPEAISQQFQEADNAIAMLECAQQHYNLKVEVRAAGHTYTLSYAVKRIGGAGRHEKMWRAAALDKGRDRYESRQTTRKADEVHAKRTVSVGDSMKRAQEAAIFASALRNAIAEGNATKLEIDWIDSALLKT